MIERFAVLVLMVVIGIVMLYVGFRRPGASPIWKILETLAIILGTLLLMVVSGIVTYCVAIYCAYTLPWLDLRFPLINVLAAIGFLAPGILVWYVNKKRGR